MAETADIIVIGGGIAGASAACELQASAKVILLEREERPGLHATGRSAALFSETYGNETIRRLTRASRTFLTEPPDGFCETPLLSPRGALFIADETQVGELDGLAAGSPDDFQRFSSDEVRRLVPIVRLAASAAGLYEVGAMDIDVDALLQGFLRGFRRRGGKLVADAAATAMRRDAGAWIVMTPQGAFAAPVVVNAAGAWADHVAGQAGLAPIGLQPKRRTAALIDGPPLDFAAWPLVIEAAERFYFKPDAGRLLISPADETDSEPCDVQPDNLDIAVAADRIETATTLTIRRITHRWAGLRTFAPDRTPVCGFDPRVDGFFWLAGQGGYGIQTSPALAALAAKLILDASDAPDDLAAAVSPTRFASL